MYKSFYQLKQEPFGLTPDPSFVYLTSQHREALSGLVYSVMSRPGLTLLIGEAGTGKTTLLYTLRSLLEKRNFAVALCVNPMLNAEEFYDFLLTKLLGKNPSRQKSQQLMLLEEELLKNRAENRPSILMIDEAHRLPLELLEEIRLLLNLETPREKLLEIILAGQQELTDVFRRPDLRQLKQRVSYVCRLKPLSLEDLRGYVNHRLRCGGRTDFSLFPDPTLRAIFEYTKGVPRLVNTICDNCLQIGFAMQARQITPAIAQEAATDLDLVGHSNGLPAETAPLASNPFAAKPSAPPAASNGATNGRSLTPILPEADELKQKSPGFLARFVGR